MSGMNGKGDNINYVNIIIDFHIMLFECFIRKVKIAN